MEPSIEDRLEAALGRQEEVSEEIEETPTEEGAESPQDESDEAAAAQRESTEEEAPAAEDDSEDVEYEGAQYRVPKALKDALLRQSDYTRKTQELAKQRQQTEELTRSLQQQRQFQEAAFGVVAEAKALESQIKRFDDLNWTQLAETDPGEYLKLDRAYRALKDQHAAKTHEAQATWQRAQQESAKQRELQAARAHEQLAREIQGWGEPLQTKLAESGRGYGFSDAELGQLIDPRMVKVLHDAHRWQELQKSKPEVAKKVQAARPVTAPAARSANGQFEAAKQAELRKTLQKSGKSTDAEALLAMRFAKRMK